MGCERAKGVSCTAMGADMKGIFEMIKYDLLE